ncbi:MAG: PAS domain S-box protein [Oligoflexia bacterium]|nr:PAS domain S-box protein [Oligoflexia bacterium]
MTNEAEFSALQRKLRREEEKVAALEGMIEGKTRELFQEHEKSRRFGAHFAGIVETVPNPLFLVDDELKIELVNSAALALVGVERSKLIGASLTTILSMREISRVMGARRDESGIVSNIETNLQGKGGKLVPVILSASVMREAGSEREKTIFVAFDVSERRALEAQLLQSQKLESVGQLAAGIAHELNTPIQYIRDNMSFLTTEFQKIKEIVESCIKFCESVEAGSVPLGEARAILGKVRESDLGYLLSEIPKAIHETYNGAESVARIVRAMKEFSHPGTTELVEVDLNKAIQSVATISRNEWKYVAELVLDLDPHLPAVPCFVGELNQAILNIIVNASHAIEDALSKRGDDRGVLTVVTRQRGHEVDILISDTGTGIPEDVQPRIYEPFYTTKEVGRGSGQGLAIAYSTIVKKHKGKLDFRTQMGCGTTFIITLDTRLGKSSTNA